MGPGGSRGESRGITSYGGRVTVAVAARRCVGRPRPPDEMWFVERCPLASVPSLVVDIGPHLPIEPFYPTYTSSRYGYGMLQAPFLATRGVFKHARIGVNHVPKPADGPSAL